MNMKDILKNKAVAIALCVLMVFMGIFMGVRRPVGNMKDDAMEYFNGNTEITGIKDDLLMKTETAYSLISVAEKYMDEDEAILKDLAAACEEVKESSSPRKAYEANAKMDELYSDLKEELDGMKLSSKDKEYNYSLLAQYNSSDLVILHNEYNTLAEEVNKTLSKFPTGILAKIAFVGKMELYGEVK